MATAKDAIAVVGESGDVILLDCIIVFSKKQIFARRKN
jgi:hypothetical protein